MALFMLHNWDLDRPSRLLNQHFGLGLTADDLLSPWTIPSNRLAQRCPYFRSWSTSSSAKDSGSTVVSDKEKFQVSLDVQQFKPEEITVKVTDNNTITVEGKHEERQDEHGFISRHFVRRYVLPEGHDVDAAVSSLSSDGVLTITAPKKAIKDAGERVIPVTHTGPVKSVEKKPEDKMEVEEKKQ